MRIIIILLLSVTLFSVESVERLDIDPVIQGLWTARAVSHDKGDKVEPADGVIAKASPASIKLTNGEVLKVRTVIITKTKEGMTTNLLLFEDTTMCYAVCESKNAGLYLLQVFKTVNGSLDEVVRFVITVEK